MRRDKLNALISAIRAVREAVNDETAVEVKDLFAEWKPDTEYAYHDRILRNDKLYRVEQAHTSQADWPPELTPALYTEIAKPGEIPVWRQPTGVQDAYMTGDEVWYPEENTDVYVSDVDNNVWSPVTYGWHKKESS